MQNNQNNKPLFSEFPAVSTEQWNEKLRADLKTETPEKKLNWRTDEGVELKAIYRGEDMATVDYLKTASFLRGTKSNNDWEINHTIETSEVAKANELALVAISRGATSIEFNCANVNKAEDMAALLKGINIEEVSIRFDKAISYKITLKHLISYVESTGVDKAKVCGSFNWDAMAYRLITGKYYQTLEDNVVELKAIVEEVDAHFPNFKVLSINAQHFHNAGSTVTQELAFALSSAVEYTQRLIDLGVSLNTVLNHIHFRVAVGSAYFMEIAKLRSLRYLWAKAVSAFDAEAEKEAKAYIHAVNSTWNKSIFDPYVNMLRTTTEAMSAAIAGVDVLTVSAFDKVYTSENEFSTRIAQNQQILIKEESHFDKVVDPAGGSYYIENLTHALIENAWAMFVEVEGMGGFAKAMESDFIKNEIAKSAEKKELDVATRRLNILGTNQFPNQLETMTEEITRSAKGEAKGLQLGRAAQGFEQLRLQTEASEKRPVVTLISFGNLAMRKARAGFISNFFACAGYEINELENCTSAAEACEFAANADIMVLCSADDEYVAFAQSLQAEMEKMKNNPFLLVAGNPTESIEDLKKAGVVDFIHVRTNVLECLKDFQQKILAN